VAIALLTSVLTVSTPGAVTAAPATPWSSAVTARHSTPISRAQAVRKAKSYLQLSAFSFQGLVDQLEFEGFTHAQAVYGAHAAGL